MISCASSRTSAWETFSYPRKMVRFHYEPDFEGRIEPAQGVVPPLPPDLLVETWRTVGAAVEEIAAEELKLKPEFPVDSEHQANHA